MHRKDVVNLSARTFAGIVRLSVLVAALMLTLGARTAFAQPPHKPDQKKAPPSFSNKEGTKHGAKQGTTTRPVAQQDVADAVLGDALNQLFEQADEHFHEGEYNHIINLYAIIVQGDPHNLEAWANGAYLLWSTERGQEAIAYLKAGITANPNTYYMYDELGTHYLINLRDPKSALPYCEQAVKFPAPFTTWHNLAFCYEKTGQWNKAVTAWEKAASFENVDRPTHDRTLQLLKNAREKAAKQR
jgi:tetratricopeptide (TPR) repeat protein